MSDKIREFLRDADDAMGNGATYHLPTVLRMIRAVVTAIDHAYIVGQDIDPGELYTALTKAMEANNE